MPNKTPFTKLVSKVRQANRKQLIRASFVLVFAVTGAALLLLSQAATSVQSVKNGRWSDATVWSTGRVPEVGDTVTVRHSVTYDMATSPTLAEVHIQSTLTFDPNRDSKLVTERNMVVTGRLVMKPASPDHEQTIQFANIDERRFVGGGMSVLASDVGLWVMGSGQLDISGSPKQSWTNFTAGTTVGQRTMALEHTPSGWRAGDDIFVTPTEAPTVGSASTQVEERTVTSVSGNNVTLSSGLSRNHPMVNNRWTAEIGNLTRNVRIEGTASGSSHIFIHSNVKQNIQHAQLRYMSVAGNARYDEDAAPLLGRYAIHFHHNDDGSRHSMVNDVVVRDGGQHAFVPHSSHGITMKNSIAFNTKGDAFWWDEHGLDPDSDSHDTIWDRNLVAKLDNWLAGGMRTSGFLLGAGFNNKITNSVVAGNQVGSESAGFVWDNDDIGVWVFDNNKAHNGTANGISIWQNSTHTHPIRGFALYHNREFGISHGAYANDYRYFDGFVYGNGKAGIELLANSHSRLHQRYENVVWDGAGITPTLVLASHSSVDSSIPVLFRGNTFRGYTKNAIELHMVGDAESARKVIDVVNSTFEGPTPAIVFGTGGSDNPLNRVRVQPASGQAYQIGPNNVRTNINKFMPSFYGNGNGLLTEYFLGRDFTTGTKVFERVEPSVSDAYNTEGHHKPMWWIEGWPRQRFVVRWTGQFQAQETGTYTFVRDRYMGMRVWLDNQLILNSWNPSREEVRSTTVNLVQGQKYSFRAEGNFASGDEEYETEGVDFFEHRLFVEGPDQPRLIIPMGQLYCTNPVCDINPPGGPTQSTLYPASSPNPDPDPDPNPPADTTAPTVTLTAPGNNSTVSGTVNLTATASDNVGVTRVEFLVDNNVAANDTSAPYTHSLNTGSLSNGQHTIRARAYDAAGNVTTSSQVSVTVNNTTTPPPTAAPEDINEDGRVDLRDFSILATRFGRTSSLGRADINNDGSVDFEDFDLLVAKYEG